MKINNYRNQSEGLVAAGSKKDGAQLLLEEALIAGQYVKVTVYNTREGGVAAMVSHNSYKEYKVKFETEEQLSRLIDVCMGRTPENSPIFSVTDMDETPFEENTDIKSELFISLVDAGYPMEIRPLFIGRQDKVEATCKLRHGEFYFYLDRTPEVMASLAKLGITA